MELRFPGQIFFDENGKQKAYPDVVEAVNNRFFTERSKTAPTSDALSGFELRFREGRLRAGMNAREYDAKRQTGKMAIGMNSVVRSFRENVSLVRGFDPATFAESVDALEELRDGGEGFVNPASAHLAYQMSLNDLLAAGVTEAHTDKDNNFALNVLASTPLRDTESVKRAISGLPEKDQKYVGSIPKFPNPYKFGDKKPDDINLYIPWAIRQLDDQKVGALQARSLKAFEAQTAISRAELDARLKGIMQSATVGSGLSRDAGLREAIKNSISEMMRTADRVYPEALYGKENRMFQASGLVALELLQARDFLDETPTQYLDANLQAAVGRVVEKIQQKFPKNQTDVLPIIQVARGEMQKSLLAEKKMREVNPYYVLQRTNKSIRTIENRLEQGDYVTPQEKMLLQTTLRDQVKLQSAKLQVNPSFLSMSDVGLIQNMDNLGDVTGLQAALRQVRDKYGDETYWDYIVPQIGAMEGMSGVAKISSFIRNPQVGDILSQALANEKSNLEAVKTLFPDRDVGKDEFWGEVIQDDRNRFFWNRWIWGTPIADNLDHIAGHFVDITNAPGEDRLFAMGEVYKAGKALALHYLASGLETEEDAAFAKATKLIRSGIGNPVEMGGRKTLSPPQYSLNEIQNERLGIVLRQEDFIRKELLPNIGITPNIQNYANQVGVPVDDVLTGLLSSEDRTEWHFVEAGIHPVIPASITLSEPVPILRPDRKPLILPYENLPTFLVNY